MREARETKNTRAALDAIRAAAVVARELRRHFTRLAQLSGGLERASEQHLHLNKTHMLMPARLDEHGNTGLVALSGVARGE